MKKTVSFLLAMLILVSLGTTGFAEEESTLTTDLILERLTEVDELSETVEDQAGNGAVRLAEMVVALDSLNIETEDEAEHLNKILDMLAEIDVPKESVEHKLAAGAMKTFEALMIFQQQLDPQGKYEDQLHQIYESFLTNDDKADGAKQQAINGLYHSVLIRLLLHADSAKMRAWTGRSRRSWRLLTRLTKKPRVMWINFFTARRRCSEC